MRTRRLAPWLATLALGFGGVAACGPTSAEPRPATSGAGATRSVSAEKSATAHRDVTLETLTTAEVPENCAMPRQRLVGGVAKDPTGANPYAEGRFAGENGRLIHGFGDLAGLGYTQALVSYGCSAGGVAWPETLVLVGEGGAMLASFDLGAVRETNRASVATITVEGGAATVTWSSYNGASFDMVRHTSTVTYSSGRLTLKDQPGSAFVLDADSFGPIRLPNSEAVVLKELVPLLGKMDRNDTREACFLQSDAGSKVYRGLTWGDLLISGEAEPGGRDAFSSWTVSGTDTPVPLQLPYGVTVGTSYSDVKRLVPGHTVRGGAPFQKGDMVAKGDLIWWMDDTNTRVATISAHTMFCE